jgi:hypothetical protein
VLDDVERRRFLVEPAREDTVPFAVGLLHVDLHEGAGQLLLFPRRGRLAGTQPHQQVLPPDRLPRVERDVLGDAVALVENAEHCDALCHRRDAGLLRCRRRSAIGHRLLALLLLLPAAASRERQCKQDRSSSRSHVYSGIQGS